MGSSDAVGIIVVSLASSFISAGLIILFVIIYHYRNPNIGGWLDFITRPGDFDDEQAFLKDEADALERMDDMQRTEYLRAKGELSSCASGYGRRRPLRTC
jgi:hypothetical protein